MKYFVPSKTFLTGEYSVLVGGASLCLATSPCFEISYPLEGNNFLFHPDSPAGRYLQKNDLQRNVHLRDPYISNGVLGGFGKSTAEYFSVMIPELLKQKKTIQQIRKDYLELLSDQEVLPSGIDLVAQYLGYVVYADLENEKFASFDWRFKELDFYIISTGLKVPTHDHLQHIQLKDLNELPAISDQVIDAYFNQTGEKFLLALHEWIQSLQKMNLTHPLAFEFKQGLEKIENILCVKPCGALGTDVMLVFFEKKNKKTIFQNLKEQKFKVQASTEDLTEGLIKDVG